MPLPSGPTAKQLQDVAFEDGVNANGKIAPDSFGSWRGNFPATYSQTQGYAHKWSNDATGATTSAYSAAGTPGGTVTYAFGANVTGAQQTAFEDALTLWSDETNVTFVQAPAGTTSDVELNVTNGGGTYNIQAPQYYSVAGSSEVPSQITPTQGGGQDTISFDESGGYGTLGSFTAAGGYGESAIVHEMGHMLGLGHTGPYNDGSSINPNRAQYDAYDSRQWSIMSYVEPSAAAKYRASYPVKGTNWISVQGRTAYDVAPETPMIDDILAVQRLYGASTSTTLAGGQVFGFNCNITDGSRSFFDFSVNTNPVVTLYDTGANNTLDLSGFSTACKIDLNPGTFSSAGGTGSRLTNNIGIAYGTYIDTAIGGSGNDRFTVNGQSDTIVGGGGANRVIFAGARSRYVITRTGRGDATITDKATEAVDTVSEVQTLRFAGRSVRLAPGRASNILASVPAAAQASPDCFVAGTRIRVMRNGMAEEVAVEALAVGDTVVTSDGARRPIRWLGDRTIRCAAHRVPSDVWPVRIGAGAFGEGRPWRDLLLSPGHPVLVGDHLVPIMCLINGTTIERVPVDDVTYWHVELDRHDILLAEGLPAESYIDLGSRPWFEGADGALHDPDLALAGQPGRCRPVAVGGPVVEAERRRLDALFATKLAIACAWPSQEPAALWW